MIFQRRWLAGLVSAAAFSLYHLPNSALVGITLLGGLYLAFFYGRYRNLLAAGIIHGWLSLALTFTLEPAGVIKNYNVGPVPLRGIRATVRQNLKPETRLGAYQSSSIPSSYFNAFDRPVRLLNHFWEYKEMLKAGGAVLIAIPADVHEGFAGHLTAPAYVWEKYFVWKRKFLNQYALTPALWADLKYPGAQKALPQGALSCVQPAPAGLAAAVFILLNLPAVPRGWISGRQDLNLRPHAPQACALPGCATPREKGLNHENQKI